MADGPPSDQPTEGGPSEASWKKRRVALDTVGRSRLHECGQPMPITGCPTTN